VITPTTHGGGKNGHDERLTKIEILAKDNETIYENNSNNLTSSNSNISVCSVHGIFSQQKRIILLKLHKSKSRL
jgi:phosphoribosylformylglycinamidine (FGAM) synthase-like amidotransferase family enzyme